jgi:hypothetical protein
VFVCVRALMRASKHVERVVSFHVPMPVQLNNTQLTQPDEVKYLGMHLDRKLTLRKHIYTKKKQLDLQLRKLY